MKPGAAPRATPPLHLVTDDGILARPGFATLATTLLAAGGSRVALHLRGPRSDGRTLFGLAQPLGEAARTAGARLVVNDRVDVALLARADGVHLGVRSVPPEAARRVLGDDALLGVSTHADEEVAHAVSEGADWIFAGTIWASPTHPGRPGRGIGAVASAVERATPAGVPVLAIGGVTPERAAEVRDAGGHGVALIRGVWDAADPEAALTRYLEVLERKR